MSSHHRNNYTHIQAFGTPSAFDPSRINRSNTSVESKTSPYRVIDVNVSLSGSKNGDIIALGAPIEPGSVILVASIKAVDDNSLIDGTSLSVQLRTPIYSTPAAFPSMALPTPIIPVAVSTADQINLGIVNPDPTANVPSISVDPLTATYPTGSLVPVYPVLLVSAITATAPLEVGFVHVKLVIFTP